MYRTRLINVLNRINSSCVPNITTNSPLNTSNHLRSVTISTRSTYNKNKSITSKKQHVTSEGLNKSQSEEEFLLRLKDDPDTFGDAWKKEQTMDEGDLKEENYLTYKPVGKRLSTVQYADIIKEFIRKKKIKEAIDVLEVRMLKEDRVKPENYIYNLLLGACGRVGYTKKAFMLFNDMKKRGLKVHPGAYTALFNACANSPWTEDGLSRAQKLRQLMIEKQYEPNDTNYNSMIKAFGRCGDLQTAFSLVDEMLRKNFNVQSDTLNFLLQACISDKEAGFRHCLLVWRKFVEKSIAPDIFTFNLMLKCIQDCGLGDVEATNDVLNRILGESSKEQLQISQANENPILQISSSEDLQRLDDGKLDKPQHQNVPKALGSLVENRPNLLGISPHLGSLIQLSEVVKPEDRLLLIGGMTGFLDCMDEHTVKPDIKTFTQLLDNIPGSINLEKELLASMKKQKVRPDLDFYNMLIKKRSLRFDYERAREVLGMIEKAHFRPNLITYGVLALGCKTTEEALELIEEMRQHSYRLNAAIIGAMVRQACHHVNFPYILEMLKICRNDKITPNKILFEHLDDFKKKCKEITRDPDHKRNNKSFRRGFEIFRIEYSNWKRDMESLIQESEPHPWLQFRQNTETDVRHFKDKEVRFKPRRSSLFRKKEVGVEMVNKPRWTEKKKQYNKDAKEYSDIEEIQ